MASSCGESDHVEFQTSIADCSESSCTNNNNNNSKNDDSSRTQQKDLLSPKKGKKNKDNIRNGRATSPKMTKKKASSSRNATPDSSPDRTSIPGPKGLPCVGSIFEWKGPQTNLAWTKQFGAIYKVQMGTKRLVYLNTPEVIEKYMEGRKGEKYLDRPMGPGAIGQGLLFGSGETWKKNKKAFMTALHTVTFEAHVEDAVQTEIKLVLSNLMDHVNRDIKLGDFLLSACVNVIPGVLLGESLPADCEDREVLLEVARNMECVDLNSMLTRISLNYPNLIRRLMPKTFVDIHKTSKCLQNVLRSWIREQTGHPLSPTSPRSKMSFNQLDSKEASTAEQTCPFRRNSKRFKATPQSAMSIDEQQGDEQNGVLTPPKKGDENYEYAMSNGTLVAFGFTDTGPGEQDFEEAEPPSELPVPFTPITEQQWTFSRQMSLNLRRESILERILKQPEFEGVTEGTDTELLQSLIDLFFGGVTSTLASLEYVFVHLVRNKECQQLAQQEIDEVLSKNGGLVTGSIRQDMPYVQACITEALRLGAVTPSSLPHVATEDTEIEGYSIPAGTFVMASIYSLHYDPSLYVDPNVFRPQRHLTMEKKYKAPPSSNFKPYGVGARRCVGYKISDVQLFVYTVNILRHFDLEPVSSRELPSLDTHMRIINRLKDFRCILRKRDI